MTKYFVLLLLVAMQICMEEAKVVKYTLDVHYFSGSPDGVFKEKILGINGKFPGPTLEANVGDTLEVTLINGIQDGQNTTIHWHGIHQKGSLFDDGTSMISQCPLPAGRSMVYRFNVTQAGTFWYHSHVNSQYTEGLFGPLIVYGNPEAYQYDGEVTLTLSDWYHRTALRNEEWHLSPPARGVPPYPESGLMNGMGRYPCVYAKLQDRQCDTTRQQRPYIRLETDKTYRLRLINAAAVAMFNFSIDGHTMNAIEVDGIDVLNPVPAQCASIAAGQRYSFLVQCNKAGKVLVRANVRKESFMLIPGVNINQYPEALMGDLSAVIDCTTENLGHRQNKQVEVSSEPFTCNDVVPPVHDVVYPVLLNEMNLRPMDNSSAPDYVDEEIMVNVDFYEDFEDIRRGSFNRTPFSLPHDKPLLMKLVDGDKLPPNSVPVEINAGSVVQLVINNPFFGPHPFHLHGHHFWVLGTGAWYAGDFRPERDHLNIHGVKRDTVLVQEQSWAVIRFVADSPGLWTFHCHIDWHNLSGMALVFVEGADIVRRDMKISDEALRVCEMHPYFNRSRVDAPVIHPVSPNHGGYHGRYYNNAQHQYASLK